MYTRHELLFVSVQLIKISKRDDGYIGTVLASTHFHIFPAGNSN